MAANWLEKLVTDGSISQSQLTDAEQMASELGIKTEEALVKLDYVTGSELDYNSGLEDSGFQVNNPNAATTCSCGESFSATERAECFAACTFGTERTSCGESCSAVVESASCSR